MLTEILKQPQYSPLSVEEQVILLYAANNNYFNKTPVEGLAELKKQLLSQLTLRGSDIIKQISVKKALDDTIKTKLNEFLDNFIQSFVS
jgi:F-type H+-transporting ATPase subunit alpha